MQLKGLIDKINPPEEPIKNFIAIEIGSESVKSAVWQVSHKQTQIVSVGSIEEWRGDSAEELVKVVDKSLSTALQSIDPEPDEVIFGLPETWAGTTGIADSKKPFLRSVTQKLDLKPVGFVITTEAIVHYLKIQEGGPPNAILLALTETEVSVTLIKLGQIVGTQVVGRSDDLSKDVEEGLVRFGKLDNLPSRMLLFDGNVDLESAKQTLLSYDWESRLPFIHFPSIESLDHQTTIKAIAIAGGAEVAKSLGLEIESEPSPASPSPSFEKTSPEPKPDPQSHIPDKATVFGFTPPTNDMKNMKVDQPSVSPPTSSVEDDNLTAVDEASSPLHPEIPPGDTQTHEVKTSPLTSLLSSFTGKLKHASVPKLQLKAISIGSKFKFHPLIIIGLFALLVTFIGGFLAYWHLPKADITIYLNPQVIEKELDFTLDTSLEMLNPDTLTIPSQEQSIELSGEQSAPATGTKLVGEKAKGKAIIYNRTQSSKTFKAGTLLSIDKYTFSLDSEVTIASASTQENADFTTTIIPATVDVAVTATDIGDKYNFSAGTQLAVASFAQSSFVAKAKTDFAGGFAREIQAISEDDRDGLLDSLTKQLKDQAVTNLSTTSHQTGIVEIEDPEIINQEFDHDIDDEASSLSLKLKMKLPVYTYNYADLGLLVQKNNPTDIPDNFQVEAEDITAQVISAELNEDGTIKVIAKVKLNLTPKLNEADIITNIKGKYPHLTESYFAGLPNFSRVETNFSLSLPSRLQTFPRKPENITVTTQVEPN